MKPRILEIGDHIQLSLAECHPLFLRWSAPLFAVDTRDRPDLFATCVAVEARGRVYLVTAAHAVHEIEITGSAIHVGGKDIKVFPGKFDCTSIDGCDALDIAVAEIDKHFVTGNGLSIVRASQIARYGQFSRPHLHCMHGYPLTKNKPFKSIDVARKKVKTYAFTYAGALKPEPDYKHPGRSGRSHVALSYQLGKNHQGVKVNPPKPKGMSGGGLWIVPDSFNSSKCFLSGILIEHHGKMVLATRMDEVLNFIAQRA